MGHAQVKGGVGKSVRRSRTTWARIRPLRRAASGTLQALMRTCEETKQNKEDDQSQRIPGRQRVLSPCRQLPAECRRAHPG